MTLTIITVTNGAPQALQATAESLLAQQAVTQPVVWFIQNAGDDDVIRSLLKNTTGIAPDWLEWRLVSEPDTGIYDGMNAALAQIKKRDGYVWFLNAGDKVASAVTLKIVQDHVKHTSADLIFGDTLMPSQNAAPWYRPSKPVSEMARGMITSHQAILYRNSVLQGTGGYNLGYAVAADYELTSRLVVAGACAELLPVALVEQEAFGISRTKRVQGRWQNMLIRRRVWQQSWPKTVFWFLRDTAAAVIAYVMPWLHRRLRQW